MPTYPAPPSDRIQYDRDGTVMTTYDPGTAAVITQSTAFMQSMNDESVGDSSGPNGGYYRPEDTWHAGAGPLRIQDRTIHLGFWFPEARNIVAFFLGYWAFSGGTAGGPPSLTSIDYSSTATSPLDPGWTTVSGLTIPQNTTVTPTYRQSANWVTVNIASCTAIRFIFATGTSVFGDKDYGITSIHLYGETVGTVDRLIQWDQTFNQQLAVGYFDYGDVPQGTTDIRNFRVHNASSTKTAHSVQISAEALTDTTPSVAAEFTFSSDGTTYSSTLNIGDIAAGATSGQIYVKRVVANNAQLGPWAGRIVCRATGGFS